MDERESGKKAREKKEMRKTGERGKSEKTEACKQKAKRE